MKASALFSPFWPPAGLPARHTINQSHCSDHRMISGELQSEMIVVTALLAISETNFFDPSEHTFCSTICFRIKSNWLSPICACTHCITGHVTGHYKAHKPIVNMAQWHVEHGIMHISESSFPDLLLSVCNLQLSPLWQTVNKLLR